MQRQRGELIPIGDALSGMGGPVKVIRDASPQAVHHFTQADQVNQLVAASEADPESRLHGRERWRCAHYPSCKCRVGNIRSCNMRTTAIP